MNVFKLVVVFLCIMFAVSFVITAAMIVRQNVFDILINDNTNTLTSNVKYRDSQVIDNVPLREQEITCGYAIIEMAAQYFGYNAITEQSLYEENGKKITTSTNGGFYKEIKKQLPDYTITQYDHLKNTEMLDKIYDSLKNKMPVICTFAAQDKKPDEDEDERVSEEEREWTLHYGVIVGIDIPNHTITINDPYGYTDTYTTKDFLAATKFESYENMHFSIKLGFVFGLFSKNTIYIIENPEDIEVIEDS